MAFCNLERARKTGSHLVQQAGCIRANMSSDAAFIWGWSGRSLENHWSKFSFQQWRILSAIWKLPFPKSQRACVCEFSLLATFCSSWDPKRLDASHLQDGASTPVHWRSGQSSLETLSQTQPDVCLTHFLNGSQSGQVSKINDDTDEADRQWQPCGYPVTVNVGTKG